MSDYTVISAVSATLRALLTAAITDSGDPQLGGVPIDLRSPRELKDANVDAAVSLWLHRVWRMSDLVNTPEPAPGPRQRARRGVPLELGYLVIPVNPDADARQLLLGRAIQVFNDGATLRADALLGVLAGTAEELRMHLHSDLIPELPTLWQALHMPYQLCMPYIVQCVVVDSDRPPLHAPVVVRREATTGRLVPVGPA
jgi:hypothetical protein